MDFWQELAGKMREGNRNEEFISAFLKVFGKQAPENFIELPEKELATLLKVTRTEAANLLQMARYAMAETRPQEKEPASGKTEKTSLQSRPPKASEPPEQEMEFFREDVRLIDADAKGQSLPNFKVQVFHLLEREQPEQITVTTTDNQGLLSFPYQLSAEAAKRRSNQNFRFVIRDLPDNMVNQTDLNLVPGEGRTIDIQVPTAGYRKRLAVPIEDVPPASKYRRPSGLYTKLKERGIHTLEDIRKARGIRHLEDLDLPNDRPDLIKLEAHAYLHTLSSDLSMNDFLIERGYTSASAIGDVHRARFIEDTKAGLCTQEAAQLWKLAKKQNEYLDFIALNRRIIEQREGISNE